MIEHHGASLIEQYIAGFMFCHGTPTMVASFPGPRPASCRLQYGKASNGKLGKGLGTRLDNGASSISNRSVKSDF